MTVYNCMLASSELEVTITKFHFSTPSRQLNVLLRLFFYKNYMYIAMFAITIFGVVIEKHFDELLCE